MFPYSERGPKTTPEEKLTGDLTKLGEKIDEIGQKLEQKPGKDERTVLKGELKATVRKAESVREALELEKQWPKPDPYAGQ